MALATRLAKGFLINRPALVRYASRILLPLLGSLYLVIVFWLILSPKLWPFAQPFAELVIQHRSWIRLFTAGSALLCASFFFWPRDGSRLVGRWSDYVGVAFGTFFIQYLLRFLEMQSKGFVGEDTIRVAVDVIVYFCSSLNNLLFLAAARVLLNKTPSNTETKVFRKNGTLGTTLYKFTNAVHDFYRSIPKWAWVAACVSMLAILDTRPRFFWARFPDAIFSAYCLGYFGYATAINFTVRRRVVLGSFALLVALAYGAGQLVYATNSVIVFTSPPNKVTSLPFRWIRKTIGIKVDELVVKSNERQGTPGVTTREFLDSAIYALLLPMKFALFLPAFSLYLLFLISVNDFRSALSETTNRRKDYLSADGIVKTIGKGLDAQRVSLFIRIPGVQRTADVEQERVLPLVWEALNTESTNSDTDPIPLEEDPALFRMLTQDGEEITETALNKRDVARFNGHSLAPETMLMVPIRFHGGVIGALRVELIGFGKFNYTTLQKLRFMSDLVAPSVQDFRALAAVDQIGFRFTALQVDYPNDSFEHATEKMVEVLHDVLAPLATGLFIDMGFSNIEHIYPTYTSFKLLIRDHGTSSTTDHEDLQVIGASNEIRLAKNRMLIRPREGNWEDSTDHRLRLGSVVLAIPAERDPFSRPTLGAYYLNRKTVASLAADGVLDLARTFFGSVIKMLGVEFSKETLSKAEWFRALEVAIKRAGLLWTVAVEMKPDEAAPSSAMIEIHNLSKKEQAKLFEEPLKSSIEPTDCTARQFLRLNLFKSKYQLWLGVARERFGIELEFQSPWQNFLMDLADVADTAMDSIQKRQQAEVEKLNTAQYQAITTIAVTTGTLMHQLINMIKDQLNATQALEEEFYETRTPLNATCTKLLASMKRSGEQMRDLTSAFKNVTKLDERRPCMLKGAAEQAVKLFQVSLAQRRIQVEINIPAHDQADVPFHVAAFALANLVGNAKDAMSNGKIEIETQDDNNFILCHVTNTGPPIPNKVQKNLFQFGKSNKHGHNGWGLYFVHKSIKENGGNIWLSHSTAESTRFSICLPKGRPI